MAYDDIGSAGLAPAEIAFHQFQHPTHVGLGEQLRRACGRIRFQLLGGILAAVAAPIVLRVAIYGDLGTWILLRNSVLGCLWSVLFGYLILRKVTAFPGVRATGFVIPTLFISFGITMMFFMAMRIQYSGFQLFAGLVFAMVFFSIIFASARSRRIMSLQLAPFGNYQSLARVRAADWIVLKEPRDARSDVPLVVDLRAELPEAWRRQVTETFVSGFPVYDTKQVHESLTGRVQVEHLAENTFGSFIPGSIYAAAKRQVDLWSALVALILVSPILLAIGLWIRFDSAGPAIFRQKRMGYRGVPFTVFKFRTMRKDADKMGVDAAMTRENDPRITRAGRLLRRTRLDELPQLVNIIFGQMSWIGPRPEALSLASLYDEQIPFYAYRHAVRPGLSGWAQVSQGHVTSVEDVGLKLQ
jgi:lipopolysaccharide/colanic/teichoic acid biosynthesis glycosyltransferase